MPSSSVLRALAASLLLYVCSTASASAAQAESGWVLTEDSWEFGKIVIHLSRSAVRMTLLDATFLSRAPDWNVLIYNAKEKRKFETSLKRFDIAGIRIVTDLRHAFFSERCKQDVVDYLGHKCNRIRCEITQPVVSSHLPFQSESGRRSESPPMQAAIAYTSRDIPAPQGALNFLRACFKFPRADGIPLGLYYFRVDGRSVKSLWTLKCEKKTFDKSVFDVPRGLKTAATPELVIGGQNIESVVKEWLGDESSFERKSSSD